VPFARRATGFGARVCLRLVTSIRSHVAAAHEQQAALARVIFGKLAVSGRIVAF